MAIEWRYVFSTAVSFMLSFMLMTAWLPFAPKRPGDVLLSVRLELPQRVLVHRVKASVLMVLCIIGSIPFGATPLFLEGTQTVALVGMIVIFMLPMKYVFTDRGVAINNGVARPYRGYRRFDVRQGRRVFANTVTLVLRGRRTERGTLQSHELYVPRAAAADVTRLLKKHVR